MEHQNPARRDYQGRREYQERLRQLQNRPARQFRQNHPDLPGSHSRLRHLLRPALQGLHWETMANLSRQILQRRPDLPLHRARLDRSDRHYPGRPRVRALWSLARWRPSDPSGQVRPQGPSDPWGPVRPEGRLHCRQKIRVDRPVLDRRWARAAQ